VINKPVSSAKCCNSHSHKRTREPLLPPPSALMSSASFITGAPLTQSLTNRASEAFCWALLALAQVHAGQVPGSIRSSRRAFALSQESKNAWVHVASTNALTYGLLDAGTYEEAFEITQHTMAFARTLPPTINFQHVLTALGSTYQALQQWEEARSTLTEADALAETLDLGRLRAPALSQLCMNYAVTGEWEQAHTYALQAIAIRKSKSADMPLLLLDFSRTYEMEALLRVRG